MEINLAGIEWESIVDGPGFRTTIFVQGCGHHCEGCHNPQTWSYEPKKLVTVDELVEEVTSKNVNVSGVTLSGGEPFDQAEALAEFVRKLKELRPFFSIAAYTGYLVEELMTQPDKLELLKLVDILVDGPFQKDKKNATILYRGSENQRIVDVESTLRAGFCVISKSPRWYRQTFSSIADAIKI